MQAGLTIVDLLENKIVSDAAAKISETIEVISEHCLSKPLREYSVRRISIINVPEHWAKHGVLETIL